MIVQIFFLVLFVWIFIFYWKQRHMRDLASKLPNVFPSYPIVGHSYLFMGRDSETRIMDVFKSFGSKSYETGGIARCWLGSELNIIVSDPVVAEYIAKNALEKADMHKFSKVLTGDGSVFAPVSIWRPRRKILAPTFSPKNLNSFVQIFSDQSRIMVDLLKPKAGQETFSIWKYITTYAMDSVCESTLGIKLGVQKQYDHPFLKAFDEHCVLVTDRTLKFWIQNDLIYRILPAYKTMMRSKKIMFEFIDEVMKTKREDIKKRINEPQDDDSIKSFLEILMNGSMKGKTFTDTELKEECLVMTLAGTDTSAVGACFTLLMLSRHPDVQEKVFQELSGIFKDDPDRCITFEDLHLMKYVEAVIKESLRMYTPVPITTRKIVEPLTLPTGVTLTPGVNILINVWAINRNPKYWNEPDVFKPERFFEPLKCQAAFATFSYSPRNCTGYQYAMMSIKTVIASIVRKYTILPSVDSEIDKPIQTKYQIMMKDIDNFRLRIESRNKY